VFFMTSRSRHATRTAAWLILSLGGVAGLAAAVRAQAPSPPPQTAAQAPRGATELAKGWLALSNNRAVDAERVADAVLKASPRDHDALALKIRARLAGRGAVSALDAYEAWLPSVREREDVFLLETIATGVAESLAQSDDPRVRVKALALLAGLGDRTAQARLGQAGAGDTTASDVALARLGDAAAVQRLAARVKSSAGRDVSAAIDALADGNVKSATGVIATALDPSRPLPTKMAAARALGRLGDPAQVPQLKQALNDPDPPVRVMAAAALAELGDPSGTDMVAKFASSPLGDLRLLAVEASAAGNPNGAWVGVAAGVLQDPDPLVRLRAADLLLQHAADPGPAAQVMAQALADPNPAMKYAAARYLDRLPAAALERDLATLRRLLRDPAPEVQVEAAAGVLRVTGAIP
jgi:hypothetical protein